MGIFTPTHVLFSLNSDATWKEKAAVTKIPNFSEVVHAIEEIRTSLHRLPYRLNEPICDPAQIVLILYKYCV